MRPNPQDSLGFPTLHQLRAALRIGRVLNAPVGTLMAVCREAHARTPSNGVFSSGEPERGQTILADAGLLRLDGDLVLPEEGLGTLLAMPEDEARRCLIERTIDTGPPLWLSAATRDGVLASEFVPSAVAQSLEELIPDLDRREEFLLAMGDRFADEDNRRVGELAEVCVVDRARQELEGACLTDPRRTSPRSFRAKRGMTSRRSERRAGRETATRQPTASTPCPCSAARHASAG